VSKGTWGEEDRGGGGEGDWVGNPEATEEEIAALGLEQKGLFKWGYPVNWRPGTVKGS